MKTYSIKILKDIFRSRGSFSVIRDNNLYHSIGKEDHQTTFFLIDFFEKKVLTDYEINFITESARLIEKDKNVSIKIFIILPESLEEYSPNFISSLYLLKSVRLKTVEIDLYGIYKENSKIFSLIQNLYSSFVLFNYTSFFKLITSKTIDEIGQEWSIAPLDKYGKISSTKYTLSDFFSPIIDISQNSFKLLFEKNIGDLVGDFMKRAEIKSFKQNFSNIQESTFHKNLYNQFIYNIQKDIEEKNAKCKEDYFVMYFFKCLATLRQLSSFAFSNKNLNNDDKFYRDFLDFLNEKELLSQSPLFIVIFSLITIQNYELEKKLYLIESKKSALQQWNEEINKRIITPLFGIFEFTKNIYKGIYELAKNIIEHSEQKSGVLFVRVARKENIKKIKVDKNQNWTEYLNKEKLNDDDYYLDISIVDNGNQGIFTTYYKTLIENEKIYEEDIKQIKTIKNVNEESNLLYSFFNRETLCSRQKELPYASYGTNIFLKNISNIDGAFSVITNRFNALQDTVGFLFFRNEKQNVNKPLSTNSPYGTSYNILIPIKNINEFVASENKKILDKQIIIKHRPEKLSVYEKMLKLNISIGNIYGDEINDRVINSNSIICFDCTDLNRITDYSTLSRKIADLSLKYEKKYKKGIVLYGFEEDTVVNLWNHLREYREENKFEFWDNDSYILFFYYSKTDSCYYCFILTKKHQNNCVAFNDKFKHRHFLKIPIRLNESLTISDDSEIQIPAENPLFCNDSLIFMDLLLKDRVTGLSYFEISSKSILLRPMKSGYNMNDVHLKVDSKIHLKDFIVAKRFFQSNNYSSGFSYLLAHSICEEIISKNKNNEIKEFVLLGYGYYSELLISNTEFLLKERLKESNKQGRYSISHFIVEDSKSMKIEEYKKMYETKLNEIKNIIIVPISSTLTTQLDIENSFRKELKNIKFSYPYYTIALVGDKKIDEESELRNLYWIKDKDKKDIVITKNIKQNKEERKNKFFIYLESEWYSPDCCTMCGFKRDENNNLLIHENKPLFIADKVSVTPSLIWNVPPQNSNEQKIDKNDVNIYEENITIGNSILNTTILKQIHKKGTNKHFNYYIDYSAFYNINIDKIEKWLNKLKELNEINLKEKYLLITPEKGSNGPFVNLVNRKLFNGMAYVLNFSPSEIALEDFITFYNEEISETEKIIFVDNLLAAGYNFFAINNVLKSLNNNNNNGNNKRINRIITLIDRLDIKDRNVIEEILGERDDVKRIYAFASYNVPIITNINKKNYVCYLCEEENQYEEIIKITNLDCVKEYILEHNYRKVRIYEYSKDKNDTDENSKRSLLKFAITHILKSQLNENFIYEIKEQQIDEFIIYLKNKNLFGKICCDTELKINILKVFAYPPFVNYKDIKRIVFKWVFSELEEESQKLFNLEKIKPEDIDYLKLLIKLSAKLQVNYILTYEFLSKSYKIVSKLESNNKPSTKDLKIFITSAIKEILFLNPHASIILDYEILKLDDEQRKSKYIDLLTLENTSLIPKAIEIINEAYSPENNSFEKELETVIKQIYSDYNNIYNSYNNEISRLKDISNFIGNSNDELEAFLYTSILYKYIEYIESTRKKGNYQKNIEEILYLLCEIIGIDMKNGGGACLIYFDDKENGPISIADIGKDKYSNSKYSNSICKGWDKSFARKIIEGHKYEEDVYYWSSSVFYKEQGIWNDKYEEIKLDDYQESNTLSNSISRLYFYRISNLTTDLYEKKKGIGVMLFYDNETVKKISFKRLRYALFIRRLISDNLYKISNSPSFGSWIEDKQKVEEYKRRFSKNTHGVYSKIDEMISTDKIYDDSDNFEIFSDLVIGKLHYSLFANQPDFGKPIESDCDINSLFCEKFKDILYKIANKNEAEIFVNITKTLMSYGDYTKFFIASLVINATKHGVAKTHIEIYNDNDYLYISNNVADINECIAKANNCINKEKMPYDSVTLFVINKYYSEKHNKQQIKITNKDNDFTVVLPLK